MDILYEISSLTAPVMSQPNISSQSLGSLNQGNQIDVLSFSESWANFKYNNNDAYVNIRNLKNTHEVDEVILLAQVSNSPWDIEIATGILNNADKERKEVLGRIDKMNFEQILNKFNDIVTKKNPSRKKGIQCFIGANNCDEINKDCVKCKNAIVTVYALNAIAKRLVSLLLEYQTTKFLGEKMKLSHSIFHYNKRINEAMDMYGKDVVYSYIQLEKRDFLLIANSIKTTEQLLIERA